MEKEIEINGVKYVQKESQSMSGKSIVRCESAGVFFGDLIKHDLATGTAEIANARRLWYWSGAASLSQLAVDGTCKPKDCKFPVAVKSIIVSKVIEVLSCTEAAAKSLSEVTVWKM